MLGLAETDAEQTGHIRRYTPELLVRPFLPAAKTVFRCPSGNESNRAPSQLSIVSLTISTSCFSEKGLAMKA